MGHDPLRSKQCFGWDHVASWSEGKTRETRERGYDKFKCVAARGPGSLYHQQVARIRLGVRKPTVIGFGRNDHRHAVVKFARSALWRGHVLIKRPHSGLRAGDTAAHRPGEGSEGKVFGTRENGRPGTKERLA
jgi:hypothetical protein